MNAAWPSALVLLSACSAPQTVVRDVRAAVVPSQLPKVVGCYENAFELANFQGAYDVVVNFDVEPTTGKVLEPEVIETKTIEGTLPDGFSNCVKAALLASRVLPAGRPPAEAIQVRGLRFGFRDGSASARATAPNGKPLLVGPRSDRCLGLYGHVPPRSVSDLHAELTEARSRAAISESEDPDATARSLQRAYDAAIELRRRLELDGWSPEVLPESRRRLAAELASVERLATELGARIGCVPSAE